MKKIYIIPALAVTQLGCETLIAESVVIDKTTTVRGTSGGWVKEDRAARSDYNVWDEDWKEQ